MSNSQKTLRTLSIIEIVVGVIGLVEGLIVSTGKASYFLSGIASILIAATCYMAATDASKAKAAKFLLYVMVVLSFAGCILSFVSHAGATTIALEALDTCIAAYMIKLIKDIHG